MSTTQAGSWWPADRAEARYHYVPVEVPPGTAALRVELSYERGAGVLDLGCYDPSGAFRGWSGGERETFTVAVDRATPGYLPGPLPSGTWQIELGLHRVPPTGLSWRVTAEPLRTAPSWPAGSAAGGVGPAAPGPRRTDLPAPAGHRWLAGDLHAHTVHSDGTLTVPELATLAVTSGLDFLAVTDHNTVSHHAELPAAGAAAGVLLLPGQEVTTDRGHANAFGDIGWVDYHRPADDWVSEVAARGGLLSINHPLGADCAWLHPLSVKPPLAEVWHSGWFDRTWGAPLAWLLGWEPGTVPVGGSDYHMPSQRQRLGSPTTWVACAEPTVDGVLAGLAAGRVAISESPTAPVLLRLGDEVIAVGADGTLLVEFGGRRRLVRGDRAAFPAEAGPHWLEDERAQILAICG